MLVFVIVMSFAGCAMPQLRVTVTAEGEWKNPLTGEKKQATIKPLVLLQPADGSEEPKRVQSFGGLDWQLWVAISPVTLTIQIQSDRTLSGVEITFNEREQKFVPAHHPLTMTAKAQGNLANNEIVVTVFVRESGRTIPKWKLLVRPERRGRPVRFLFEAPAIPDENLQTFIPFSWFRWEAGGFFSEISPQHLRREGTLGRWVTLSSWRWVPRMSSSVTPWKALGWTGFQPPGLIISPLSTPDDEKLLSKWQQWFLETLRPQTKQKEEAKVRFFLSAFQEGKVIVHYAVTAKVLLEVSGELAVDEDLATVRSQFQNALAKLPPVPFMPDAGEKIRREIREGNLKPSDTKEIAKILKRYRDMEIQRDEELAKALQQQAKKLGLVNMKVKVVSQCVTLEPKEVERQLRPLMLTLKVQLQGEATCAYHRQKHIIPLSGKVHFKPLKPSLDRPSPLAEHRRLHWEGIPDEPVEISVPKESTAEVQLPAAWFNLLVSEGVQVDASAEGWQPFKTRLSYGYELFQHQQPIPLTIRLTPTHAEEANFLLELPFEAKLKHATIVVQDEKGKVIASQTAQWLADFESHGIVIKKLPYGVYRVAAEGSFTIDGKEHPFSVVQTLHVNDYHDVLELRVERSR
jgi:hypothetical protein